MSDKLARAEAEDTAQSIVEECGFTKFPICPFEIARRHDIHVEAKQSTTSGVSGFLMRVENTFGIRYAQHIQNEGFIRFTVAHELGHYFLPGHPEKLFANGNGLHESRSGFISNDPLERQADYFASALLMPIHQFREAVDWAGSGFAAIEKLATECKTSITATAIRYTSFTDDAVAVVVSSGDRVDYCFMSESLRNIRGLTWIKKGDPLPRGATRRFNLEPSNIEEARREEATCHLEEWFDGAPDMQVNEDVVGLGSYGKTLTVLFTSDLVNEAQDDDE